MDTYLEQATEQRRNEFPTVREWVFGEINRNLPTVAREIAEVMACPPDCDQNAMAIAMVDHWHERLTAAIAQQQATIELAAHLRREAEEEAQEADIAAWYGNPYLEGCHDREVRSARREAQSLAAAEDAQS